MEYELLNEDYNWFKKHEYVLMACKQNDFSVLSGCSQGEINRIHNIFNTWVRATVLADRLEVGLRYNRITRGY